MKSKHKVYIAGKIGNLPRIEVELKFSIAKIAIQHAGFEPISPLENGLPIDADRELHIKRDVALLCASDSIFLLGDWIDSPGARFEVELSLRLGIPAYVTGNIESHAAYVALSHFLGTPIRKFSLKNDEA